MHNIDRQVNKILEKTIFPDTKVVVGVSGGPDSMYLLYKLKSFWEEKVYNIDNLCVITCDHQTRKETGEETKSVYMFSHPHPCTIQQYTGTQFSEKHLRERRHKEFIALCKANNAQYLFLGHHLNDRIETTILNIMRGCGVTGVQSIQEKQKHYLDPSLHIIRPLIYSTKREIEEACNYHHIPYSIDPSNSNDQISKRNKVRYTIRKLKEKEKVEKSLSNLYTYLDKHKEENEQKSIGILLSTKAGERDQEKLYAIYKNNGIVINPRANTLHTLSNQLKRPGSTITYQGLTIRSYSYGSVVQTTNRA